LFNVPQPSLRLLLFIFKTKDLALLSGFFQLFCFTMRPFRFFDSIRI